jgi:anti-sigma factor RsiW
MECKEALPLIHEYLDGGLRGTEALGLKEHLLGCASCRERMKQFEKVEALIHAWPAPNVSPDLTERVMRALPPALALAADTSCRVGSRNVCACDDGELYVDME